MQTHIISLLVEDNPGALARISGMFTQRGINISSLTVSPCEKEGLSRMTVVVDEAEKVEQVRKQLDNLIEVIKVIDLGREDVIIRDLCLVQINAKDPGTRSEIMQFAEPYDAKIVDATLDSITMELTAEPKKIDRFVDLMRHFGMKKLLRTGITAIGLEK